MAAIFKFQSYQLCCPEPMLMGYQLQSMTN